MPPRGISYAKLTSQQLVNYKCISKYRKEVDANTDKEIFNAVLNTACNTIRDFIINDPEGVKLPYIGLILAYTTKPSTEAIERYYEKRPYRRGKVNFSAFMGKISWIRYSVSRFRLVKCYSFEPDRTMIRTIKKNVGTSNLKFMTCLRDVHTYGKMLLKLDDTITRKLKRYKNE